VLKVFLPKEVPGRRNFTPLMFGDLVTEVKLLVVGLLKIYFAFALEFGGYFWGDKVFS